MHDQNMIWFEVGTLAFFTTIALKWQLSFFLSFSNPPTYLPACLPAYIRYAWLPAYLPTEGV